MKLKENYIGSLILIATGALIYMFSFYNIQPGLLVSGIVSGPGITLAAIAYMFTKKRRIYVVPTVFNTGVEILSILSSVLLLVFYSFSVFNDIVSFLMHDPLPLIIWLGVIISYFIVLLVNKNDDNVTYKANKESYIWGYFMGACYFIFSAFVLGFIVSLLMKEETDFMPLILLIPAIAIANIGYLIIKKNRSALILGTVLTFNPIIWIINYFYIKNRYEMLN
jgi:hypothetical protein